MSTHTFDLFFLDAVVPDGQGQPKVPVGPIAHVCLKSSHTHLYYGQESPPLLTPREFGYSLFEEHVDRLIAELQDIKAQARRRFDANRPSRPPTQ